MALLSDTTYNRLAKSAEDSCLILINSYYETIQTGKLITLTKTKSKIKTRWESVESDNVSPFTHVALVIKGKPVLMSSIKPIEKTLDGWLDIEYESA